MVVRDMSEVERRGTPAMAWTADTFAEDAKFAPVEVSRDFVRSYREGWDFRRGWEFSRFHPVLATTVQDPAVFMPFELEGPEGIAGPPVVVVSIENDGRVV